MIDWELQLQHDGEERLRVFGYDCDCFRNFKCKWKCIGERQTTFWFFQAFQISNYNSHRKLNLWTGLKISHCVSESFMKSEFKKMALFGNAAKKHMDLMADMPRYVNLNDEQDRDSMNDFCYVWNQYIPYCSFCTAPLWVSIPISKLVTLKK